MNSETSHSPAPQPAGRTQANHRRLTWLGAILALALCWPAARARADAQCDTSTDMDAATRSAMENAASQFFRLSAAGDFATLKSDAIPSVASDFGGIERAISDNQANLQGAQPVIRGTYLLTATGNAPLPRAEFFCGIFNSPDRSVFVLQNLPPGIYGVVMQDVKGGKKAVSYSLVLQQIAGQWKLGGLYIRANEMAGHDGNWYLDQARQYKMASKNYDAWFYYSTARYLLAPVEFMSTVQLDKIADEMQAVRPPDLPSTQAPLQLTAGGKTYNITDLYVDSPGDTLDIVAKYVSADISNNNQTYADNMAVIKALVARIPQLRDAFGGVVARAVSPSGGEYGTLLSMKEIK